MKTPFSALINSQAPSEPLSQRENRDSAPRGCTDSVCWDQSLRLKDKRVDPLPSAPPAPQAFAGCPPSPKETSSQTCCPRGVARASCWRLPVGMLRVALEAWRPEAEVAPGAPPRLRSAAGTPAVSAESRRCPLLARARIYLWPHIGRRSDCSRSGGKGPCHGPDQLGQEKTDEEAT